MTLIPYDCNKTFWSMDRAEAFVEYLKTQGVEDAVIWSRRDAFNQNEYIVCWNI